MPKETRCTNAEPGALLAERIRALFKYDPQTGHFTRKVSRGNAKAGTVAGSADTSGYLRFMVDGESYAAHRLAWLVERGFFPERLDHRNRDKLDNRIDNLRLATRGQNRANAKSSCASGYKGVSKAGTRWRATIRHNGIKRHLGYFDDPEQAHYAYCAAAEKLHGPYSCAEHVGDKASRHRCTNAEPGTFNGECGRPATWIGTNAAGHEQAFCDRCKADGWEAAGRAFRKIKES